MRFFRALIRAFPFLSFLAFLLLCLPPLHALALLLSLFSHECAHVLAFLLLGEPRPTLSFHNLGLLLHPSRPLSYGRDMLVTLAGPIGGFFLCLPFVCLLPRTFAEALFVASASLSLFHLLPLLPLDGGRFLFLLFCLLMGPHSGALASRALSFTLVSLLLFFSLYSLLYGGEGLPLMTFSLFLLFYHEKENFLT